MKAATVLLLIAFSGCASVSKSKRAQVQTSFNQSTAPIKYGVIQRAAASR